MNPARVVTAVIVIVGFAFCLVSGIVPLWFVEAPARIAFGWIRHAIVVFPKATVNWSGVGFFAILLPVTALLAHSSAGWIWRSLHGDTRRWRWKWTLMGLAMVMLMFAAGIGATGVVHQTGWLITSKDTLLARTGRARVGQIRCQNNLRQIGLGLQIYARENAGYRPTDQADFIRVVLASDVSPEILVCPLSNDEPVPVTQPSDWVKLVGVATDGDSKHVSYRYLAQPVDSPEDVRKVTLYESIENHENGINVLYDDGKVGFIDAARADVWLKSIGASAPPTLTPQSAWKPGY